MSDKQIRFLITAAAVLGPLLGFGLIMKYAPENIFNILPIIAIIIYFCLIAMLTFFAWQKRKVTSREEKHASYTSILSIVLVCTMLMSNGIFDSLIRSILLILFGIIVVICWNWYMRRNPDLSNQKFHLIYFLSLMNIVLGCFSLSSILNMNLNVQMILFMFVFVGITVLYTFQNRIFKS